MYSFMLVGIGGFLGAISRFGISQVVRSYISHPFPAATMLVNVLGCFALGGLLEYFREHQLLPAATLLGAVGFLGSFTTFSAFSFETLVLIRNDDFRMATLNIVGNLVLCIGAIVFGGWVGGSLK
ncbi:MAG: fluoride efflux transporter CrcB [Bdellovibrionales bacterium]